MPKEIYKCENCEEDFDNLYDCTSHEIECIDEGSIIRIRFGNALNKLKGKYDLFIDNSEAVLWVDESHGYISKFVQVNLIAILPNGRNIEFSDSYWNPKEFSESEIYNRIESVAIIPYLATRYEGEIWGSDGYGSDYIIGDITITEIARRFHGKKVRFEIIQ